MPEERHVLEGRLLSEDLEEGHRNLYFSRIHHRAVVVEELLHEVLAVALEVPREVLCEACEDPIPEAHRGPVLSPCDDVPQAQLGPRDGHLLAGRHDPSEDLDLMSPLILILILVPPEAHFHLVRMGGAFREDPPAMPMMDNIMEGGPRFDEGLHIHRRRGNSVTEDPQGDVQVRPREGPIEGHVLLDGREELGALRELPVVLEELLLPFGGLELHTNAHRGPCAVEARLGKRGQDAPMHMLEVRRGSIAVGRGHQERARVDDPRLLVEASLQGSLNALRQLPGLEGVRVAAELRRAELGEALRGHGEGEELDGRRRAPSEGEPQRLSRGAGSRERARRTCRKKWLHVFFFMYMVFCMCFFAMIFLPCFLAMFIAMFSCHVFLSCFYIVYTYYIYYVSYI